MFYLLRIQSGAWLGCGSAIITKSEHATTVNNLRTFGQTAPAFITIQFGEHLVMGGGGRKNARERYLG